MIFGSSVWRSVNAGTAHYLLFLRAVRLDALRQPGSAPLDPGRAPHRSAPAAPPRVTARSDPEHIGPMCLDPILTLEELPEVIDLNEAAARPHRQRTDRLDLHQLLADLYRRLVNVEGRQLASAADLDNLWSQPMAATSCSAGA